MGRCGYLTATEGGAIDYGFIRREINEISAELDVRKGMVDPYNAVKLVGELREADGLPFEFLRQGFLSLSDPTKEFKRLIDSGELAHDGNPVMRGAFPTRSRPPTRPRT